MFTRLTCAVVLAFGLGASASAQTVPVKFGVVPTPQTTKQLKPIGASRGFNAANAARAALPPRPNPGPLGPEAQAVMAALARPDAGTAEAAAFQLRELLAASISMVLLDADDASRTVLDAAFGAIGDADEAVRHRAWELFFKGAHPIAGTQTEGPATAYFVNPVYDAVAVIALRGAGRDWAPERIVFLAGERVRGTPVGALPAWTAATDRPLADVLAGDARATRSALRPDLAGDDRDLVLARILSFQKKLGEVVNDAALGPRLTAVVKALADGRRQNLTRAGLQPTVARQVNALPHLFKGHVLRLGAVETNDGAVAILALQRNPGIVFIAGLPRTGSAVAFTPAPLLDG